MFVFFINNLHYIRYLLSLNRGNDVLYSIKYARVYFEKTPLKNKTLR